MHARVTTIQVRPGMIEEAIRIGQETTAVLLTMAGFHELTVMADRATGNGLIVSLWDSEAAMTASASGVYGEAMSKLAGVLTGPPSRSNFEVVLHRHTGEA